MLLGMLFHILDVLGLVLGVERSDLSFDGLLKVGLLQEGADHDQDLLDGQLRAPEITEPLIAHVSILGVDVRMIDGSLEDQLLK